MNGTMVFNTTRQRVVNVISHEQDGRTGWLASDSALTSQGFNPRETQMFYPADMYRFEPEADRG